MTCELCINKHPNEIWRNDFCYVIDAKDSLIPGYIRVVLNNHIAEMSDLTQAQRHYIMDIVNCVEISMREVMNPKKINLAAFGTMVPHLHWHIIAHYEDDSFYPASTWSEKKRDTRQEILTQRRLLADKLNELLVIRLNQQFIKFPNVSTVIG